MKKLYFVSILIIIAIASLSAGFSKYHQPSFSGNAPSGYTGADGGACNVCHSGQPLNNAGGAVSITGLPAGNYLAGSTYNFSLNITHAAPNRTRWGFSIVARNNMGQDVGSFTTSNPNAIFNGSELGHNNAPITAAGTNYTFNNLTWTAPTTPGPNDQNVTFYYVGNAANGDGGTSGDFIYTGTNAVVLPVLLTDFSLKVENKTTAALQWVTTSEINTASFLVEQSNNATDFETIATIPASGNSSIRKVYTYKDQNRGASTLTSSYRITTVDIDGKKSYSEIKKINFEPNEYLISAAFPNPVATGEFTKFQIKSDKRQTAIIRVFRNNGQLLSTQNIQLNSGGNIYKLAIPENWASGAAILQIAIGDRTEQIRFMIAK